MISNRTSVTGSTSTLGAVQRKRACRIHNFYQFINNFAFMLVNGSIVTLYALKVGSSVTFLGLVSSLNFLSFTFVPLGNLFSKYVNITTIYAWAWTLRYLSMLPILAIPFAVMVERHDIAIILIFLASVGFNIFRGIGMVGNNPIIATISTEKERGRYVSLVFMLTFLGYTIGTLFLVFIVQITSANLWGYNGLFLIGILCGLWASYYVFLFPKIPESQYHKKTRMFKTAVLAIRRRSLRIFFLSYFGISFVLAMVRSFAIVYTKTVYNQNDGLSILYTTIGFLGALIMAAFSRLTIMVVGAKALYIFYMIISIFSLLPAILSPEVHGIYLIIFLLTFHFLSNLGMQGMEIKSQTYLFGILRPKEISNFFTLYYTIYGIGGTLGAIIGGLFLNFFQYLGFNVTESFRIFFLFDLILLIFLLYFLTRLQNTGRRSVAQSLGYIFNIRDMRVASLVNKLEETSTASGQLRILNQISRSDSDISEDFLIEALHSPRMEVRYQAFQAIESISSIKNPRLIALLLQELNSSIYITSAPAARILGKMNIIRSIPELRLCLQSPDYRLQGDALYALSQLKDVLSLPLMLRLLRPETNEYVLMRLILALEKLLTIDKIYYLFRPLMWEKAPQGCIHEGILSASQLLGMLDWFYALYCTFLNSTEEGYIAIKEFYQSQKCSSMSRSTAEVLFRSDPKGKIFLTVYEQAWECKSKALTDVQILMKEIAKNPLFLRHTNFRFLLIAYLVKECTL